jgi:hypothetical protein
MEKKKKKSQTFSRSILFRTHDLQIAVCLADAVGQLVVGVCSVTDENPNCQSGAKSQKNQKKSKKRDWPLDQPATTFDYNCQCSTRTSSGR